MPFFVCLILRDMMRYGLGWDMFFEALFHLLLVLFVCYVQILVLMDYGPPLNFYYNGLEF